MLDNLDLDGDGVNPRAFIAFCVVCAAITAAAFFAANAVSLNQAAAWNTTTAEIVDTPEVTQGPAGIVVTATVRSDTGAETNLVVADQARRGDLVQVLERRSDNELYRATSLGADPFLSPGKVAAFVAMAVLGVGAATLLIADQRNKARRCHTGARVTA